MSWDTQGLWWQLPEDLTGHATSPAGMLRKRDLCLPSAGWCVEALSAQLDDLSRQRVPVSFLLHLVRAVFQAHGGVDGRPQPMPPAVVSPGCGVLGGIGTGAGWLSVKAPVQLICSLGRTELHVTPQFLKGYLSIYAGSSDTFRGWDFCKHLPRHVNLKKKRLY